MARQRKLHPAAKRHALNRCNTRFVHALDAPERQLRIVGQHACLIEGVDLIEQLANVGAGHKR